MKNKKFSIGAWITCCAAVLALIALIVYAINVGAAGYFQGASVRLCNPMDCSLPGDFLGKNPEVGCHSLLQGIFPTQRSNQVSCVFCVGRRVLYHGAAWEAQYYS